MTHSSSRNAVKFIFRARREARKIASNYYVAGLIIILIPLVLARRTQKRNVTLRDTVPRTKRKMICIFFPPLSHYSSLRDVNLSL